MDTCSKQIYCGTRKHVHVNMYINMYIIITIQGREYTSLSVAAHVPAAHNDNATVNIITFADSIHTCWVKTDMCMHAF